jgi:hypothetical protein
MRRFYLRLLGLSALAGMVGPALAAAVVKARGGRATVADFEPTADEIDLTAIFEGFELRSRAPSFRGGDLLLWYGGGVLDLRGAGLDPAGGTLRVRSIFGGMQLVVPDSWPVRVRSRGFVGGVGSEAARADASGPALVIDALSVFGGIGITTGGPDAEETGQAGPNPTPADVAAEERLDIDPETAGA